MNYIILIICSIILPIISINHKPKLCLNCKFFIPDTTTNTGIFSRCSFFPNKEGEINFLVNGIIGKYQNDYCSTARCINDMCGEEGKHYKKKKKIDLIEKGGITIQNE